MSPLKLPEDAFSHLPTPSARWKARNRAKGLCINCIQPPVEGRLRCVKHLAMAVAGVKRMRERVKGISK